MPKARVATAGKTLVLLAVSALTACGGTGADTSAALNTSAPAAAASPNSGAPATAAPSIAAAQVTPVASAAPAGGQGVPLQSFCKALPASASPATQKIYQGLCAADFLGKAGGASVSEVKPGLKQVTFVPPLRIDDVCKPGAPRPDICRGTRPGDTINHISIPN